MHLNLKARVFLWHVVAVGLILAIASFGADWAFRRMVLGEFDQSLLDLAETEATAAMANPAQPIRVHEMSPGTAPPSFPRLDKFIQIVDLDDGQIAARSANLGTARLPTPRSLLDRLRTGETIFETRKDFGAEPIRLLSVPIEHGHARYAIQVGGSLDDADAVLRSARLLFLAMSAAILTAVALTGVTLARAILRPIDEIVRRARVMGASALADRLPHPGSQDEIARLVETLNEMLGRIEQVFEAQRRFTADASHELRSPLSRLRAELEVTLRRPRERPEYEEALRSCLSEVERLSRLVEELLTLARLDAGEVRETPAEAVALRPILGEAVARLASEADRRSITLLLDAPTDLAVRATPGATALVVANVLDNAVKFSPPGGQVRVEVTPENGTAVVAVSDSGPGIAEEDMPRLFERFYRGSAARGTDVPGVGLGLAICRLLVEAQGGAIAVARAPGGGATVRIRLPLAR
ncbi:MAG TPA: HAMP domain-containing sensor histidine kinase [Candidatus Methylomirabilis sp.]|nr:HAMP domain-containing sensor histidine kinase [Candidatus Methylomirabilis sp.]